MPSRFPSGSSRPPSSVSAYSFWIGLGLAGAAITLAVLGFTLNQADELPQEGVEPNSGVVLRQAPTAATLVLVDEPTSIDEMSGEPNPLHQLVVDKYAGRRVYRIRATTYGDEIIVDYVTGKLMAVQELPGKFSIPPAPMEETIVTSS
jgi:hypothetical protein